MGENNKQNIFFGEDDDMSMNSLFSENVDNEIDDDSSESSNDNDNETPTDDDIKLEDIFPSEDNQGSVGGEEKETVEQPNSQKDEGSSPKTKFYSSALKALVDDGVLSDLDQEFLAKIKDEATPEYLASAIEKQVEARLDATQKRINDALSSGVQIDDVKRFENAINYLSSIDEDVLSEENDESENLRKQIIYQDYINKGFKPERAQKEVTKSFNAGTDIEDAKIALESNKEYFQEQYDDKVVEQKAQIKKIKEEREKQVLNFRKKIIETEEPLGIKVDKSIRQKVLDNIVKPVHKGKDGKLLTEIQKYSIENPDDSEYYFGLLYTMTDGFKNVDKFISQKVKQSTKSALKNLEHKLKNTPLMGDGEVDFNFGQSDEESYVKNIKFI